MEPSRTSRPATSPARAQLTSSVPLFDPSQMPLRTWCEGSREDAVTGLVAFPDFHSHIPRCLVTALSEGRLVALSIGDVDGLKNHVERTNSTNPASYGHLAGNEVMATVGATTRAWFREQPFDSGCAATFGGDEVIIAAVVDDVGRFHRALGGLRDRLGSALPVTVSFALMFVTADDLPAERERGWRHAFTDTLLATVDRALFMHKAARRAGGGEGGIIAVTRPLQPTASDPAGPEPLVLLPLPTASDIVHVVARPERIGGRDFLLLPCRGPVGQRGTRLRIGFPTGSAKTVVAYALRRQAAVPYVAVADGVTGVPLTVQGVRDRTPRSVPEDLAAALERAGLDWTALPAHEQAQILHLVTEAGTPEIRTGRITAAVDAVAAQKGTAR
ncbi:YdeI/OmpD-associated family protein [Streptomyces lydicus]|uniref:YdeI/OmpD-associated family protein n=1 Tax=Streptomyces lydicus TaxID=47763 RepID=UPI00101035CC|nr:YdeI/OmpD-associated family protein [Streptomyces lydicus]MCZ1008437.1 YdeI/OmpD-associated family protein [Streptomyces lydicus]